MKLLHIVLYKSMANSVFPDAIYKNPICIYKSFEEKLFIWLLIYIFLGVGTFPVINNLFEFSLFIFSSIVLSALALTLAATPLQSRSTNFVNSLPTVYVPIVVNTHTRVNA